MPRRVGQDRSERNCFVICHLYGARSGGRRVPAHVCSPSGAAALVPIPDRFMPSRYFFPDRTEVGSGTAPRSLLRESLGAQPADGARRLS